MGITVDGPLERGQRVTITVTWYNADDTPYAGTDPTVTWEVLSPSDVTTTPAATKVSAAVWTCTVDLTEPGVWSVRPVAAGALVAAASGSFRVVATPFDA
jgi:hypothetical protein